MTPPIVCLCGSSRFVAELAEANRRFMRDGWIVLAPADFAGSGDPLSEEERARLGALHLAKIDLAEQVFVVNPQGYVGESTRREIAYATEAGIPVAYLAPPARP